MIIANINNEIDFTNFKPLLNNIKRILELYNESI